MVNGLMTEALVNPCECSGAEGLCHFTCCKAYYVSRKDLTDLSCPDCKAWYKDRYGTLLGEHGAYIAQTQKLPALQVGAVFHSLALAAFFAKKTDRAQSLPC